MKYFMSRVQCYVLLLLLCAIPAAQQSAASDSFIPSHESAIRMLALHNDSLYALDENGLLTISSSSHVTTKSSSNSYMVIHRKHGIREAKFLYPYIVFVDNADILHVYDIAREYTVFSSPYERSTDYVFSPSKRLFFYVDKKALVVVDTAIWEQRQRHMIDLHPSYMAISSTEKNIMLYDPEGVIVYKNTYSGQVLKRISTLDVLKHLSMNSTKRFAVGISGEALAVVDLVSGYIVDSIVISSVPRRIFATHNSNRVLSLGRFSDNAQIVQVFDFSPTGALVEKDVVNIENTENVSALFAQNQRLYLGFEDGSVSLYDLQDRQLNPVLFDETIANYDAQIVNDILFFANADGIRSIALSSLINKTGEVDLLPQFMPQVLVSPIFAVATVPQSLPYVVSRVITTPLLFTLKKTEESNFRFSPPVQLSLVPSAVMVQGSRLFAYSQQSAKAQFIHYTSDSEKPTANRTTAVPFTTNTMETSHNIVDFLMPHSSIAFDFNADSRLFTNAPLYENNNEQTSSNVLYAYRVLENEKTVFSEYVKDAEKFFAQDYALQFPFSMDTIIFIRKLPSQTSRSFILVRKVRSRLYKDVRMETLLVDYPMDEHNEHGRIILLARENYDEQSLFLYRMSGDYVQLITLARDSMFLTVGNTRNYRAVSHTQMPYPQKISRIISAHVTGAFLSAVDINNLAFVATLDGPFIDIEWLMMLNQTNTGRVKLLKENLH